MHYQSIVVVRRKDKQQQQIVPNCICVFFANLNQQEGLNPILHASFNRWKVIVMGVVCVWFG